MDIAAKNIGEVFDGRYQILRTVGVGGMAIVYEALDLVTGRHVAVKTLKDSISDSEQALRRFINETKAVAMLSHENIVKILDVSVKTEHKFFTMEYIDGITLRDYMNDRGPLPWREAMAFITQILLALDHAHMKGVIHRDIKPQNIMVLEGGKIKVTDFGIAKIPDAQTVTMIDHAVGTIYYLSPEQAKGKKIDSRSDLYSLGVMFYEMVTGKLPFLAENAYGIMHKHINDAPTPPTQLNSKLPLGAEQIILLTMEKSPDNRYQSASQILRHIYRLQSDPTTIFQTQRPALRTPTSEVAIIKTQEKDEELQRSLQKTAQETKSKPTSIPAPPKHIQTPVKKTEAVSTQKTATASPRKQETKPTANTNPSSQKQPQNTQRSTQKPQNTRPEPSKKAPDAAKKKEPIYVPFSVVIVICIVFLILAVIGFFTLFELLYDAQEALSLQHATDTIELRFHEFPTRLWKTFIGTENLL